MRIPSINSNYSSYNMLHKTNAALSSGKRINPAADDAAGVAIAESMKSQSNRYQTANRNITDSKSLLDSTSGALSGVSDSLQRMRDLALQSSNGIYSAEDKQIMQDEISQLKDQINQVSRQTDFNGTSTLNGSALNLSGTNQAMGFDASTDGLGISDFDVTGDFDIGAIDNAIRSVGKMQGSIGAVGNGMEHAINSNQTSDFNTQSSLSLIQDADMARSIMELQQQMLLQKSDISVQKKTMQQMSSSQGSILNMRG